ncbi:MAG: flagellar assembly protein A [bacterium]|tara:strand:- start:1491 stop:3152 length:1662 start_codon:yes stop_codon:yes gene_type:complete
MPKADLYKISITDGKVLLRIPQQLIGAETANIDDIQAELHLMGVDYIPEKLQDIYERTSGEFDFLTDFKTTSFTLQIQLSKGEEKAYLNIIPPMEEDDPLTLEMIIRELKEKNILQGIKNKTIEKMIAEKIYYEPLIVASGKETVQGRDGFPELLFLPEKLRPAPGTKVNLREVPVLQKVQEGQELIRIETATMGEDGYTITGKLINSTPGKQYRIRPGRNTRYNPEGTHIIATKSGVVCINNDNISVEKLKVIEKVDASTGHVRFDGIVSIRGNVSDRCSVEAVRIDIGGSVGKARLRSIGEIRVSQGLKGTVVQCGSTLLANNMTDTQASVGDHAMIDEFVVNSKIYCGSTLEILSANGYVSGGVLQAGNLIRLPNVGLPGTDEPNEDGEFPEKELPQTILDVGISLKNRKQFNELEKLAQESLHFLQDDLEQINTILEELQKIGWDETKINTLTELESKANKNVSNAFSNLRKREVQDEINVLNKNTNGGVVFITGKIPAGTAINVRRSRYNVLSRTTDKAYSFGDNGIQAAPTKELLKLYQGHFLKLPV